MIAYENTPSPQDVKAPDFVHLHVHTEFSLLDGSSKIKEITRRAKELGMKALAITDHGVMYGAIDFYKACLEAGIRPIIGCEVYVAGGSRFDREEKNGARYDHLVLLAENNTGYENLMKLVSYGFTEGFYYKPRIDFELLEQYHEGLIALSACLAGVVARPLLTSGYEAGVEAAKKYSRLFGPEHFYLEIQDHGDSSEQTLVNQSLLRMARELSLPLVATNDVHYIYESDKEAHDMLLCIQTGKKVSDENRLRYEGMYHLKSPAEMAELFAYAPEAIENTVKIAERCQIEIRFHERKLPAYPTPEGEEAAHMLRRLVEAGLRERYADCDPENPGYDPARARFEWQKLQERKEYELSVIESMGFVDYFLIVWDFIDFARRHQIKVGPGRGSGVGSIVSYSLHITSVEPIGYNLVFERLLNPERVSMPDIDTDFCYRRRQEVIDYVTQKYGPERVAQIVTFGTMAARLVIRDVGRVMDLPYGEVDRIAKMIPRELDITIESALVKNPDLKKIYDEDPQIHKLIDMSMRLEGLPRHTSTHAAGVLISQSATMNFVPLCTNDGNVVTQYTMNTLEELGLLKMDFLGLRTLTVIQDAVDMIWQSQGKVVDIDQIDMNDPEIFQMISQGKTEGVFQLESAGMTQFMRELRPESLEDIIAGISLYRPGPMDFIPKYVKGKKDPASIVYDTPLLEPILEPTYGCIVYQEQVMQIVRDLAGYTMGRSDLVRRAMSKKKADVMEKERHNFIYGNPEEGVPGCVARGIDPKVAEKIFNDMTDFASYAFNKSHASAYAVVGYQTAYLKHYYPVEFMASMMTSVMDHTSKLTSYIQTVRQMGIELLPPDINEGFSGFSVTKDQKIRYGLSSIKAVGRSVVDRIVKEREERGPFKSMTDFCQRLSAQDLNKRALESLIKAGAFDSLGGFRSQYLQSYPMIMDFAQEWNKRMMSGQIDLFDMAADPGEALGPSGSGASAGSLQEDPLPKVQELDEAVKLSFEKEVLGIYLTGHPLSKDEALWRSRISAVSTDFSYDAGEEGVEDQADQSSFDSAGNKLQDGKLQDGAKVTIGGLIAEMTIKTTKTNQLMAFVTIEDLYGTVETLIFPKKYDECRHLLQEDSKVFLTGRVSLEEEADAKLIVEKVIPFSEAAPVAGRTDEAVRQTSASRPEPAPVLDAPAPTLWLRFESEGEWKEKTSALLELLKDYPGESALRIYLAKEGKQLKGPESLKIACEEVLLQRLRDFLGEGNIALR